jgi:polysaccharide chain length determinant protein (PEP-CTERM system associated)
MLGHRTLSPEDYFAILKKRWWIIAIPALLLPVLAFAASYLVSPQYTSQTLVLVEQQKVPDTLVKPVIAEDISARLASMKEQILSRSRLQPILERFNLFAGDHMNMDDRLDLMRKNIDIKPIQSEMAHLPGFFISFKASEARTAQAVCEEITSMFVSENLRARADQTQGTTDFLRQQLDQAKRSLDDQDAKLAKFQQQYVGKLPGQEEENMNMLNSLNTQLSASTQQIERMQQDKTLMEAMLTQQQRETATPETQKIAPQAQQTELQSLLSQEADLTARYTDDYPDVVSVRRKIKDLKHQMAQAPAVGSATSSVAHTDSPDTQRLRLQIKALDMQIAQRKRDQSGTQGQVNLYQERISASPLVQEQYKNLTRDYQQAQAFYDDLLKKMNESRMASDLEHRQQGEQFRVMDAANLPDAPTSPKRPVFAAGGLIFGLALGLAIVALLEYRNTVLRNERDIWAFTKLPTLATVSLIGSVDPAEFKAVRYIKGFLRRRKPSDPKVDSPLIRAGS